VQSAAKIVSLPDRGVISVTGPDARTWLDNLLTNDLDLLDRQDAVFAGLLTPQGKILFEFFVVRAGEGLLLDTQADQVAALVKRLSMYKLRAKVEIRDVSADYTVLALWGTNAVSSGETAGTVAFGDPRNRDLGRRILAEARFATDIAAATNGSGATPGDYAAHRVALGIAEAPHDYALGDTFPHDANWGRYGVSFTKGCYVGQEVVSRMQNKAVVRKRVVKVSGSSPLASGTDVKIGDAVVGRIGTTSGTEALAMVRLDRAAEAEDKGQSLTASGVAVTVDPAAIAAYRDSVKNKPVINL